MGKQQQQQQFHWVSLPLAQLGYEKTFNIV